MQIEVRSPLGADLDVLVLFLGNSITTGEHIGNRRAAKFPHTVERDSSFLLEEEGEGGA